jgi:hypothetical protein
MVELAINLSTIGEVLLFTMQRRKQTLRDVAPEIGCCAATLSRLTRGKECEARWLVPIAKWCELGAQELWDLLEAPAEPNGRQRNGRQCTKKAPQSTE